MGVASCAISWNLAGNYGLTATYTPGSGSVFDASYSVTVAHVVTPATTTTTVTSATNPSTYGQSVTFAATVVSPSGQTPTGTVIFKDGSATLCNSIDLSSGSAICTLGTLSVATHSITAIYSGDANNVGSTSSVLLQIVKQATSSTALTSSINPSTFGQSVTFTAMVTGQSPTGTVTFNDGATAICTAVALAGSSASCTTATVPVGVHSITAAFNGDVQNAVSTSNSLVQQVTQASSATTLTSAANPSMYGENVTFTATVAGQSPTGPVTFSDSTTAICTAVALSGSSASCTTSILSVGMHSITATFGGDTQNIGSTSNVLMQQVLAATTTTLTSSKNSSTFGQNVTFTSTVTGQSPTGTVTFKEGATEICTAVALSGTSAACTTSSLSIGSHSILATYSGDTENAGSNSNTLIQQVKAPSTTTLANSPNPSHYSQSVVFTATVSGQAPTGTVTFNDGATTLCAAIVLNSNIAACPTSTLSIGSHAITATYTGDDNNLSSSSFAVAQSVEPVSSTTELATACDRTFVGNQPFTMSASVVGFSPTGNVTFTTADNLILCANALISAGSASCTTNVLSAKGSDTQDIVQLIATYSGDTSNTSSISSALNVTVLSANDVTFRNGFESESSLCPIE